MAYLSPTALGAIRNTANIHNVKIPAIKQFPCTVWGSKMEAAILTGNTNNIKRHPCRISFIVSSIDIFSLTDT